MAPTDQIPARVTGFVEDRSILARAAPPPDEVIRYGDLDNQIADIRYGKGTAQNLPLIVLIHGGFWRPPIDRQHASAMCAAIGNAGWTVASMEYRRIPGEPDATTNDVESAISQLPSRVRRHGGKTIVIGHSAGGHLALWAASHCRKSQLSGAIALGPIADLQYAEEKALGDGAVRAFLGVAATDRRDLDPATMPSPSISVTLVHGLQDAIAPVALSDRYQSKHMATRVVKIEDCGHFALIDPATASFACVLQELKMLAQ